MTIVKLQPDEEAMQSLRILHPAEPECANDNFEPAYQPSRFDMVLTSVCIGLVAFIMAVSGYELLIAWWGVR